MAAAQAFTVRTKDMAGRVEEFTTIYNGKAIVPLSLLSSVQDLRVLVHLKYIGRSLHHHLWDTKILYRNNRNDPNDYSYIELEDGKTLGDYDIDYSNTILDVILAEEDLNRNILGGRKKRTRRTRRKLFKKRTHRKRRNHKRMSR